MSTFEKYPITNELVNFESIKSRKLNFLLYEKLEKEAVLGNWSSTG